MFRIKQEKAFNDRASFKKIFHYWISNLLSYNIPVVNYTNLKQPLDEFLHGFPYAQARTHPDPNTVHFQHPDKLLISLGQYPQLSSPLPTVPQTHYVDFYPYDEYCLCLNINRLIKHDFFCVCFFHSSLYLWDNYCGL